MEIKAKEIKPNKPIRVKSIEIKDGGKKSFSEKKVAYYIVDETANRWVVEVRDGKEHGRWNMDYIVFVEWL